MPSNETFSAAGLILGLIGAYLAGSVNFSILLFRLLGKSDPRARYSGNAGATNVYRQAGWLWAAAVVLLDVGRAAAVALAAHHFWPDPLLPWAGWALILGNHWPCFHGWRGGKGVANFIGFYIVLIPLGTLLALTVYGAVLLIARISSVASLCLLAVLSAFAIAHWGYSIIGLSAVLITAAGIIWFHRANIMALASRKP